MAHLGNTIINGKLEVNGEIYTKKMHGTATNADNATTATNAITASTANKLNILEKNTKGYLPAIDSSTVPNSGAYELRSSNIEINGLQNQISLYGISGFKPRISLYNKELGNDDGLGMILKDSGINFYEFSEASGTEIANLGIKLLSKTSAEARFTNFYGTFNGNATSATTANQAKALTAGAGSSTIPVYINSSGKPVSCSTTLGVSITGNASTATTATTADKAKKILTKLPSNRSGYLTFIDASSNPNKDDYYELVKSSIQIKEGINEITIYGTNNHTPKLCINNVPDNNDGGFGMLLEHKGLHFHTFGPENVGSTSSIGFSASVGTDNTVTGEARFTNFYGTFNGDLKGKATTAGRSTGSDSVSILDPANTTSYLLASDNNSAATTGTTRASKIEINTLNSTMGVYGSSSKIDVSTYKNSSSGEGSGVIISPSGIDFHTYSTGEGTTNGTISCSGDNWNASFSSGSFGELKVSSKPVVRSAEASQTISVRIITQSAYDALGNNKDDNTIYFIKG